MYYYVLFPNHISGLSLEKHLKNEKVKYEISPTPRSLSVSCGISIKIDEKVVSEVESILKENNIPNLGIKKVLSKNTNKFFKI